MNKNREQSAVDVIYDILEEIKKLHQKIDIIDNNVKLLNNKIGKQNQSTNKPMAAVPNNKQKLPSDEDKTIKLFGRIKNQNKKPIKDVYIKVRDPKGDIIKSRETNAEGYWEARVFPGEYVIELDASNIIKRARPQNFSIKVDETMNEYEVKGQQ